MQRRAVNRFPDPSLWLWTRRSLAQASDWWCATFKAQLFPPRICVVDGCCGAGADLVALRHRGEAIGIDRDHELIALANSNLQSHGLPASAQTGELPQQLPAGTEWLHLDPDRRASGEQDEKRSRADQFSPDLQTCLSLTKPLRGGMIKLSPSTHLDAELSTQFETSGRFRRIWLGNGGQSKQQLLLTGELADAPALTGTLGAQWGCARVAVLCDPGCAPNLLLGDGKVVDSVAQQPQRYLYDCHPVLHSSGLQSQWAASIPALSLGHSQGYFTSDNCVQSPWAQVFEIQEVLPWDQRRVKRWLRENSIGQVEIKKRLIDLDANQTQKQLRGAGSGQVTLLITRWDGRVRAIAGKRVGSP